MTGRNSTEVATFMVLLRKLKGMIDDDPGELEQLAQGDPALTKLCLDLGGIAFALSQRQLYRRRLFSASTDPAFIKAWRDYEGRYASPVAGVFFDDLGFDFADADLDDSPRIDIQWKSADQAAGEAQSGFEAALSFAEERVEDPDFPNEDFALTVETGLSAWRAMTTNGALNLRGILRRRTLVPFVLVPRHVADKHGHSSRLSLFTQLQSAQEAFVFGVQHAALALMRALMETTLKAHYASSGKDLDERINSARGLPQAASREALHRLRQLANSVLHAGGDSAKVPDNLEREVWIGLFVLRALIEAAPSPPSGRTG